MKKVIGVVVILAIGAAAWWYFSGGDSNANTDMFLRTAVVSKGDLVVSISSTGSIEPVEQVEVKSKASGEIMELPIQEGDIVKKGQLIARLDRTTAQNDYDQAQADYTVAEATVEQQKKELDRQQSLFDKKLASEFDLDNARLAYDQAKAQLVRSKSTLSTAKERLDDTEIHAPIDGVVLTRPVEVGQIISSGTTTVTGGTLLCTIANMSRVYVVADVDETDIGKVKVGMPARITPDAYPDQEFDGKVLRISPLAKVEQNVTMFEVTTMVDNLNAMLLSGMNATVEVVMAQSQNTMLLPARAVEMRPLPAKPDMADSSRGERPQPMAEAAASGGGQRPSGPGGNPSGQKWGHRGGGHMGPAVQVMKNGIKEWVPIKTGLSNLDNIEVLSGLNVGDTVVYSLVSGSLQQREEFRDRMRERSAVPGMKRSGS